MVWYTGQFYALFFLQSLLKVDGYTANLLIAWSLILGTGFFVLFGWLSDKIGRKPIILGGCLLAALTYFPLFKALTAAANPALHQAQQNVQVVVTADPAHCSFQFNPTGHGAVHLRLRHRQGDARPRSRSSTSSEDARAPGTIASVRVAEPDGAGRRRPELAPAERTAQTARFNRELTEAMTAAGYPPAANPSVVKMAQPVRHLPRRRSPPIIGILFILVLYVTMVYGPIAAALVELFPTRIRYTAMSLPYHIGNGWFGGLLPATAFAIVAQTGDIYAGLWYPIMVAVMTVVIGLLHGARDQGPRHLRRRRRGARAGRPAVHGGGADHAAPGLIGRATVGRMGRRGATPGALLLSAGRRRRTLPRPLAPDADAAGLPVAQLQVDHRRHHRVVQRVVLVERRNAEVAQDGSEAQVEARAGRRVPVLALVVEGGDLDLRVGQLGLQQRQRVLVQHPHVEIDVVADQRPPADEAEQLRQHAAHRLAALHVPLAQPVHLDGARRRSARPPAGRSPRSAR